MKRNFQINEDIFLIIDEKKLDLHNDFVFQKFVYDAIRQEFSIECKSTLQLISFLFSKVKLIKIKEADVSYPRDEATCISFVGFLQSEDLDIMNGFSPDNGSENVHFVLGLQNESTIKIGADRVFAFLS